MEWQGSHPQGARLFGLTNSEGNHGEDVKEYYFYLDSTPTHSYMKYLYKYPQRAFPYDDLVKTNKSRSRTEMEYELLDTGVFDDDRYWDVFVEYAKLAAEDTLIQITLCNRGAEAASLHVLPTLLFRNQWTWWTETAKPVNPTRLRRILTRMLDEQEFLSPFGIRALSRYHLDHPYVVNVGGQEFRVTYLPAESDSGMFGGNSNWRGPVWMPVNVLIIRALLTFYLYYGDNFKIECPTGSGQTTNLFQVGHEIANRLTRIFLRDASGRRPVYGGTEKFRSDPHWKDNICSSNISTGTMALGSAQAIRRGGPAWSQSCWRSSSDSMRRNISRWASGRPR